MTAMNEQALKQTAHLITSLHQGVPGSTFDLQKPEKNDHEHHPITGF
jgi:hypothetical protein